MNIKKGVILLIICIFSIKTTHAWLGLFAENGDILNTTKWNELVNDKLSIINLKAGNNITLSNSGSDILINGSAGGSGEPFISNSVQINFLKGETKNVILGGYNFSSTTIISSPAGTINSTTRTSPVEMTFNMTAGTTAGTYDVQLSNGGTLNTVWTGNGTGLLKVSSNTAYYSCKEIIDAGDSTGDGDYTLTQVGGGGTYDAYCDMTTDGGGWTRIVRTNSDNQEWGQKNDSYTYAANNADTGIYDAYRYVQAYSKTMLKHIDSSTFASYNLVSASTTESIYDLMTYCKGQTVQQSNDTAWDGARLKGMTSTYSGQKVAGTMTNVDFFFMCGVNEENDNDQSYLTFARASGQTGNGYADSWRNCSQTKTTWSLLNGDYYQATNYHIGNNYSQCSAGRKADGSVGHYEVYIK